MILKNIALIAADTSRTKAYLQAMIMANVLPEICIIYSDDIQKMQEEAKVYKREKEVNRYFNINEPIYFSLEESSIPYIEIQTKDINSEIMIQALKDIKEKYLIYSGYGGYILKEQLFQINKKFIHIHAGILPQYRGSTTAYYSYLQEKTIGATAIFLNDKIDEGEIILQENFDILSENIEKIDIDYIYEPYIRSQVLIKVLKEYQKTGKLESKIQESTGENTYYIIHPLLKHIALLGIQKMVKEKFK